MARKNPSAASSVLTVAEIEAARRTFVQIEPRHIFYRVATELIDLSLRHATKISVAEALAVLLQTWNKVYYQYNPFDESHFRKIEQLVEVNRELLERLRPRSITTLRSDEEDLVRILFLRFEQVLGPVGAAKCLHLLAPSFFPLWDRAIAKAYGLKLDGGAFDEYVKFMRIVRKQCEQLANTPDGWSDLLKAIDEYNYCTYTLKSGSDSAH